MAKTVIPQIIQQAADQLGKYEAKTETHEKRKWFLNGTCLTYEDELCENVRNSFNLLAELFGEELDEDKLEDAVSGIRDRIIHKFERLARGKMVWGNKAY